MQFIDEGSAARRKRLPPGRRYYVEVGEGGTKRRHCAPVEIQLQVDASFGLLRRSVEVQKQRKIKRIIADVYFDCLPQCIEGIAHSRKQRLLLVDESCGSILEDDGNSKASLVDSTQEDPEATDDQRPVFCSRKKAKGIQNAEVLVETPSDTSGMDDSEEHSSLLAYDASEHEGMVDPWPSGTRDSVEEEGHWIPGFA